MSSMSMSRSFEDDVNVYFDRAASFSSSRRYLPRVAFNLDFLFRRVGAHGKQALTMAMGFGCNAAGLIATASSTPRASGSYSDLHDRSRP